jgi:hypothetical protein
MVHCFILDLSIMETCPVSVCIDGISPLAAGLDGLSLLSRTESVSLLSLLSYWSTSLISVL